MEERAGTKTGRSVMLSGVSGHREKNESQEYGISRREGKEGCQMGGGQGYTEKSCVDLEVPAGHLTECSLDHLH